jgi:hypothetical protein
MTAMVFMVGLSPAIEAKSARHFGKKRKLADGTLAVKPVELRDLSICRDCASMGHVQPHPTPRSLHPRRVHQRTIIRLAARQEYFAKYPKDRFQTEIESWRELQSRNIEYTMKRLREPLT